MNISPRFPNQLADVARAFSGRRLTLARKLAGLRKNALAERIGKTPTAVASYENGTKRPAAATVAKLALSLGVEPSFFLAGGGDDVATQLPHFRSLRSTTQVVRDQANSYGLLAHDIVTSLERHVEFPIRNIPQFPVSPDRVSVGEPEDAARKLRAAWGINTGPVGHLIRLAEHHGIIVIFSIPQAAAIDAFSIETAIRPLIMLNPVKDDYFRQRFDVAHEMGHLVMHADAEPGGQIIEDQAHRFAAEFLMPEEELVGDLPVKVGWPRLFALKDKWNVSLQALLMRARQLSVMNESSYNHAMATLSARGWRRREPGVMPTPEQPSLLPRSLELLEQAGYDMELLANECRVPVEVFRAATARRPTRDLEGFGEQATAASPDPAMGELFTLDDFRAAP
ncbi:helix-turn-helix domain-containing protein [Micromonospora inaquosa]|uniref:Xre family DNA binding protein n=1 Tax=Micromonospora inaquosa TaxID=2203716 RepID=A0A3N9WZM5_9ACTN|nr:XRE family transcriptional regulator [Micromonospora inaquosa]RQX00503.1 Xre family DNA binding protein [Micromonospora inaquosa]